MSLSIGIVGLPNVGKSTLFNALTSGDALAANYPFATIEPNTGVVAVPDNRLQVLADMYHSAKTIPASVTFVDIAGLVTGASHGEGLGNKFLANIRECNAVIQVVRAFIDNDTVHVADSVDPARDIETINTELALADIETIDSRLDRLQKELKANPTIKVQIDRLNELKNTLEKGDFETLNKKFVQSDFADLNLLSLKPTIYVFNIDESDLVNQNRLAELTQLANGSLALFICAKLEAELKDLPAAEAQELLESYGVDSSGLQQIIIAAYNILGLQSYLTAGPQEVRAWTIPRGATAPEAAGVIHTDFAKGFIAAQIIDFSDLVNYGSEIEAKKAGKIRTEGKTYIMQPNDVVEFRFNVDKNK